MAKLIAQRTELAIVCAVLVVCAAWMDLSSLHRFTNADWLMMSLVSLYKWTPMFWEQNRLGMLLPALAIPFRHPLTNMLVQGGLAALSGLGSCFLLGYYIAGRRRGIVIGSLSALLFVLFLRGWQRFCYFIYIYQFHLSLSLALVALLGLAHWQRDRRSGGRPYRAAWVLPLAILAMWAALWVNPSLVFAVGPLVLLRRFLLRDAAADFDAADEAIAGARSGCATGTASAENGSTPALAEPVARIGQPPKYLFSAADWLALAAAATGLLVSMAVSRFATDTHEQYGFLSLREWLACAGGVLKDLTSQLHRNWFLGVAFVAASGLVTLRWADGRRAVASSATIALGLLIPAAVQLAFVTSLDHVHRTDFGHYAFASAFLWQGALVGFAVLQWTAVLPQGPATRRVPWVLLGLLLVVVAARHGRPGVDVVRRSLNEAVGRYTPDVLDSGCTHVVGDFWHVWPTMFHANMLLADRGQPARVWGVAFRCRPTSDTWAHVPVEETRVAEIIGDEPQTALVLARYGLPRLEVERELRTIRVLRPSEPFAASLPLKRW